MLDLRRRRWANIGQTYGRCVVFAGLSWTNVWLMRSTSSLGLAVSPLRGRGLMYLLYPKNSTWRWLRAISTPRSEKCPYFNVRPLSWACGHGTEMLLILKKLFSTWLFPDIFKYDSPKKCPTIFKRGQSKPVSEEMAIHSFEWLRRILQICKKVSYSILYLI